MATKKLIIENIVISQQNVTDGYIIIQEHYSIHDIVVFRNGSQEPSSKINTPIQGALLLSNLQENELLTLHYYI